LTDLAVAKVGKGSSSTPVSNSKIILFYISANGKRYFQAIIEKKGQKVLQKPGNAPAF
jgi:hypothetical protein